jgi:hypothetical protein
VICHRASVRNQTHSYGHARPRPAPSSGQYGSKRQSLRRRLAYLVRHELLLPVERNRLSVIWRLLLDLGRRIFLA